MGRFFIISHPYSIYLRILTLVKQVIVFICDVNPKEHESNKQSTMKAAAKRSEVKGSTYLVKLRIDNRTVITVRTKESLKNWKAKYPDAVELT